MAVDALGSPLTTDLSGNPRVFDGDQDSTATVDMGALEYVIVTLPVFDPIPEITIEEHALVDFLAHATDPEGPLTHALIDAARSGHRSIPTCAGSPGHPAKRTVPGFHVPNLGDGYDGGHRTRRHHYPRPRNQRAAGPRYPEPPHGGRKRDGRLYRDGD